MTDNQKTGIFLHQYMIIACLVVVKILIHMLTPEYGIFRDEYFYIAIADQLSWKNLDLPPLTPFVLKPFLAIFGYSVKSLHFASSFIGSISLVITCLLVKDFGGKKYAIFLTGLFNIFSGFMIFASIFTYDSMDFLIWVTALYILAKIMRESTPKKWLLLALVLGLGFLNKLTILFLGLTIAVALLLSPQRVIFKKGCPWVAAFIALLFSIPFIIWQVNNDWYFIDVATSYSGGIAFRPSIGNFLWQQFLPNNPWTAPAWITGLVLLLFSKKWWDYRFFGFAYLFLLVLMFFTGAKFYFMIPLYVPLYAVGAIHFERLIENRAWGNLKRGLVKTTIPALFLALTTPLLPLLIPVLPIEKLVKYLEVFGVDAGVRTENLEIDELPQYFADRFGWPEMVEEVAAAYETVRPGEGEPGVGILTDNWGEASAVHYYKDKYNLPEPISMHGWYYFHTARTHEFVDTYVALGIAPGDLMSLFRDVQLYSVFTHPYCIPHENNSHIVICRDPVFDLEQYWRIAHRMDRDFERMFKKQGVNEAINWYREQKANNPDLILYTERQMNALGYEFLFDGKVVEAIEIFRFNVEEFPHAWNVYDSLGEAYMENGQYDLAVENYNKSIELNQDNQNGRDMLERIEALRE